MSFATRQAINWTEQGLVPDSVIRGGIRRLLRARLAHLRADDVEFAAETDRSFHLGHELGADCAAASQGERAALRAATGFFAHTLGPSRKYSCCDWAGDAMTSLAPSAKHSQTPRTRATRRRATDPGARLRLGLADAAHGAALSSRIDRRRVEFSVRSASTSRARRSVAASKTSR